MRNKVKGASQSDLNVKVRGMTCLKAGDGRDEPIRKAEGGCREKPEGSGRMRWFRAASPGSRSRGFGGDRQREIPESVKQSVKR